MLETKDDTEIRKRAKEVDEEELDEPELFKRMKEALLEPQDLREMELEKQEKQKKAVEGFVDDFIWARQEQNFGKEPDFVSKFLLKGLDKFGEGLAKGIDAAGQSIGEAANKGIDKAIEKLSKPDTKIPGSKELKENPELSEDPEELAEKSLKEQLLQEEIEEILNDEQVQDQNIEVHYDEEDGEHPLGKKKNTLMKTSNLKSPETSQNPEVDLQPTESDESRKQRLIAPQFLELTKDYRQQTGGKINYGLEIQQEFRNWIRSNPTLEPSEKQRVLEYCGYYEALIEKAIMGQVLFSDKSLNQISKDINRKFEMSASNVAVKNFIREKLREKDVSKRFSPNPKYSLLGQIPEIVQKYKQGANERELAKEYNVSKSTIHYHLKKQEVEPHGHFEREINPPQEFTPDLAKFIALIVTEGSLDETKSRVTISNTSYALIEEFKNLVRRNFQIDNFYENVIEENNPNRKNVYHCEISSVELAKFLSAYVDKSDYQNATLPKEIFALSEENIGEVLRIAFSAEGSVLLYPRKRAAGRWNIRKGVSFGCTSPSLKKQWSRLIESLGIKCRIFENQIYISGEENIIKFKEKIDFMDGISIKKNSLWEDSTRREVLNALIESYKYPRMGFYSKGQALKFLKSLFKK